MSGIRDAKDSNIENCKCSDYCASSQTYSDNDGMVIRWHTSSA